MQLLLVILRIAIVEEQGWRYQFNVSTILRNMGWNVFLLSVSLLYQKVVQISYPTEL
jgi:hypothetical protein